MADRDQKFLIPVCHAVDIGSEISDPVWYMADRDQKFLIPVWNVLDVGQKVLILSGTCLIGIRNFQSLTAILSST